MLLLLMWAFYRPFGKLPNLINFCIAIVRFFWSNAEAQLRISSIKSDFSFLNILGLKVLTEPAEQYFYNSILTKAVVG